MKVSPLATAPITSSEPHATVPRGGDRSKSLYRCARGKPAESRPETHQRAAEALPSLSSVPSPLVHFPAGSEHPDR